MKWKYDVNDRVVDFKENGLLKRDITILELKIINNKKWYKYKCNICNWNEGLVLETNFIQKKSGCSCCKGLTIVRGINTVGDLRPDLIQYFENKEDAFCYTIGTPKKVKLICPDCRTKHETSVLKLTSRNFRCKNCGNKTSYPERFVQQVLKQLNIEYKFQVNYKILNWCDKYIYDFYLPNNNYIIEVHGAQHYENVASFYGKTYDEIHKNDIFKQKLAESNNIKKYITIDASKSDDEYLKKSIINELDNYFDLSIINWNDCARNALKSVLIEVCKYWEDFGATSSQIGKIFNISRSTVKNYLNKGAKLGICKYDGEKEKERVKKMQKGHQYKEQKLIEICNFYNEHPNYELKDICKHFNLSLVSIKNYLKLGSEQYLCSYSIDKSHYKRSIGVFKDDKLILIHSGANDLANNSEKLLGVKLSQGHICSVCRGERLTHKGFVFKFLD